MAKKKTVFISDLHLSTQSPWAWFDPGTEGPHLVKFFEYVQERAQRYDDIKELVLLGDVFDLWVTPHDQPPHTFEQILQDQELVLTAIKNASQKVKMLYVNGNHDFRVDARLLESAVGDRVQHIGGQYRRGNILAEHGHRLALFNRPDPKNGGAQKLPLGYYISRLYASLGEGKAAKRNLIWQAIDEAFQMMGPEKLPQSVLDAMKDAVEQAHGVKVDSFNMGETLGEVAYEDIRERYKNLFDDWVTARGHWYAIQMVMSELNRLGTVADKMCKNGVNIVVMGHSHDTKMDKDSWFVQDRIYANCGYWCGFHEPDKISDNAHFIETDGEIVSLYQFSALDRGPVKTLSL